MSRHRAATRQRREDSSQLLGETRDRFLNLIRRQHESWPKMPEMYQRMLVREVTTLAEELIAGITADVRANHKPRVLAKVRAVLIDEKGVSFKMIGVPGEEATLDATRLQGRVIVIVDADTRDYDGLGQEPVVDPDQRDLLEEAEAEGST